MSDGIYDDFSNLHSRNSRNTNVNSDQSLLESRICERTLCRGIRVGRHFPYRGFLISGQDFQGKTMPLLRYLQLLGKRSPPKMLWTSRTELCRVSEWERGMAGVYYKMGEYMFSDSLMLRRSGRKWSHNSIHVIVWVPRALVKCCLNFLGNSRCYIEFSLQSVYGEPMIRVVHHESGPTSFPKTLMPAYQPPHSQVNTRREIWWNETVRLSTDNGQFKEFARATKHPVGTMSTSGRRVAHKKCYLSNGRKSYQSNSYDR